jgi:hypothetical protein
MTGGPLGVKHPSKAAFLLAALTAAIAFLLTMIAIFVPWSWKDSAVLRRTYIGLWQNCVQYTNDPLNGYMCHTNDIDQVGSIAGGSKKCRGYIAATQVFTVAGNVFAFLTMVCCFLVVGKLWSKPLALAAYAAMNAFLAFSCILVAFLMWIVYAETSCQAGNALFPVRNYSWGWILVVIATLFSFLSMLLAYVGLFNILRYKPFLTSKADKAPKEVGPMYLNPDILPAPSPFGYPAPAAYPSSPTFSSAGYAPPAYMPYPMF